MVSFDLLFFTAHSLRSFEAQRAQRINSYFFSLRGRKKINTKPCEQVKILTHEISPLTVISESKGKNTEESSNAGGINDQRVSGKKRQEKLDFAPLEEALNVI